MSSILKQHYLAEYYCTKAIDLKWKNIGIKGFHILVLMWDLLVKIHEGVQNILFIMQSEKYITYIMVIGSVLILLMAKYIISSPYKSYQEHRQSDKPDDRVFQSQITIYQNGNGTEECKNDEKPKWLKRGRIKTPKSRLIQCSSCSEGSSYTLECSHSYCFDCYLRLKDKKIGCEICNQNLILHQFQMNALKKGKEESKTN